MTIIKGHQPRRFSTRLELRRAKDYHGDIQKAAANWKTDRGYLPIAKGRHNIVLGKRGGKYVITKTPKNHNFGEWIKKSNRLPSQPFLPAVKINSHEFLSRRGTSLDKFTFNGPPLDIFRIDPVKGEYSASHKDRTIPGKGYELSELQLCRHLQQYFSDKEPTTSLLEGNLKQAVEHPYISLIFHLLSRFREEVIEKKYLGNTKSIFYINPNKVFQHLSLIYPDSQTYEGIKSARQRDTEKKSGNYFYYKFFLDLQKGFMAHIPKTIECISDETRSIPQKHPQFSIIQDLLALTIDLLNHMQNPDKNTSLSTIVEKRFKTNIPANDTKSVNNIKGLLASMAVYADEAVRDSEENGGVFPGDLNRTNLVVLETTKHPTLEQVTLPEHAPLRLDLSTEYSHLYETRSNTTT